MSWSKIFSYFAWHDKSQASDTPLSAANLNKLNDAIDAIDDRLLSIDGVQNALKFDSDGNVVLDPNVTDFDDNTNYYRGDHVYYNGHLYVCIVSQHYGAWVNSHFQQESDRAVAGGFTAGSVRTYGLFSDEDLSASVDGSIQLNLKNTSYANRKFKIFKDNGDNEVFSVNKDGDVDMAGHSNDTHVDFTVSSVSSLPVTVYSSDITSDMKVVSSEISNPAAIRSDLTVTTAAGSCTVSGTISGTTNITLQLARVRAITVSTTQP